MASDQATYILSIYGRDCAVKKILLSTRLSFILTKLTIFYKKELS